MRRKKDLAPNRTPDEPQTLAAKDGEMRGFEALFASHESDARDWIARHVVDANVVAELLDAAKADAFKKQKFCDPDRAFPALLQSRCLLVLLRHFTDPGHHDQTRVTELAQELERCPGFAPRGSSDEVLLALEARHSPEAFNRLWDHHVEAIEGFLTIRMRNREAKGDVLHNTFLALRTRGIVLFDPTLAQFQTLAKAYAAGLAKRFMVQGSREVSLDSLLGWGEADGDGPPVREPEGSGLSLEELVDYLEQVRHLLRVTFGLDSPPHQLIVFGFNKLLGWMPGRIVSTLFSLSLSGSEQRLEKDYVEQCLLESDETRAAFEPLRNRLLLPFRAVVTHSRVRNLYEGLLERVTGQIILQELYRPDTEEDRQPPGQTSSAGKVPQPEDVVAKWVGNVRKSVRNQLLRPAPGSPQGDQHDAQA